MEEFIDGRPVDLTEKDESLVNQVKKILGSNQTFLFFSRQSCRDSFIQMSFRNNTLSWSDLPEPNWEWEDAYGKIYYIPLGQSMMLKKIAVDPFDWKYMVFRPLFYWYGRGFFIAVDP